MYLRPLEYHARTEHRLPRNVNTMQDEIDNLTEYTDNHPMAINTKKKPCCVITAASGISYRN